MSDNNANSRLCQARRRKLHDDGGVWPFMGGFYVAALAKYGRMVEVEEKLERLAEADKLGYTKEWGVNEFLHRGTGRPKGSDMQFSFVECSYIGV